MNTARLNPGIPLLLNGVTKRYGDNTILNELDLHIPSGQFVAVVGRSGGGKSTLLRLLAGLENPNAGGLLAGAAAPAAGQGDTPRIYVVQPKSIPAPANSRHHGGHAEHRPWRDYAQLFASLQQPRFVVTQVVEQGSQCFLTWEFHFRFQRFAPDQARCILGASHLLWNTAGQVRLHRDYWDAAEELYEKLPVVGALMRWLRRQAAVSR